MTSLPIKIGHLSGAINSSFNNSQTLESLARMQQLCSSGEKLSHGGDFVIKNDLHTMTGTITVAIKVFKRQSLLKDAYDKKHKSKAERSYLAACYLQAKNIGTPEPIAWLERWEKNRLVESYYVCRFEAAPSLREVMAEILWDKRDNQPLMEVLQHLAPALRAMHDAGFMHGDMGNQNILLPKTAEGQWCAPQWIDLNRSRIFPGPLGHKERAKDLARLAIPGAYMKIFKMIYCNHQTPDPELDKLEHQLREKFWRHRRNSKWRHPIRHWKNKRKLSGRPLYPAPNDVWLWDEKTAQPMISLGRKEKHQYRKTAYVIGMVWHGICALPGIYFRYKKLLKQSYQQPRNMAQRVGVALHPHPEYIPTELALLQKLGNPPVFVRFYHHETPEEWERGIQLVEQLHAQNIPVMIGLLQDRRAILEPASWSAFLNKIIRQLISKVSHIEITHATNRVKWGVWSSGEYLQLMRPALELKCEFPQLHLTGPACIDFEYLPVIAALKVLPNNFCFSALSHFLYVDRRGAPENKQGYFSTLEKSAMIRALAQWSKHTEDRVIISEVNWPVKQTGIWSPIGCPYETPNWRRIQPGESEQDYASYMLRFLAITLCSGHVEQVFWWRLSAHGYGLVDDKNQFTPRPAFYALAHFLKLLGNATFTQKLPSGDSVYLMKFVREDQQIVMGWSTQSAPQEFSPPWQPSVIYDAYGEIITDTRLTSSPKYFIVG